MVLGVERRLPRLKGLLREQEAVIDESNHTHKHERTSADEHPIRGETAIPTLMMYFPSKQFSLNFIIHTHKVQTQQSECTLYNLSRTNSTRQADLL